MLAISFPIVLLAHFEKGETHGETSICYPNESMCAFVLRIQWNIASMMAGFI